MLRDLGCGRIACTKRQERRLLAARPRRRRRHLTRHNTEPYWTDHYPRRHCHGYERLLFYRGTNDVLRADRQGVLLSLGVGVDEFGVRLPLTRARAALVTLRPASQVMNRRDCYDRID